MSYDSHSREHSLRCQIGQWDSKIRKCEALGDERGKMAALSMRNGLSAELREILDPTNTHKLLLDRQVGDDHIGLFRCPASKEYGRYLIAHHIRQGANGEWFWSHCYVSDDWLKIQRDFEDAEREYPVPKAIHITLTVAQAQALIDATDEIVEIWEDLDHDDLSDGKTSDAEIDRQIAEYQESATNARDARKILMQAIEEDAQ